MKRLWESQDFDKQADIYIIGLSQKNEAVRAS